MRIFESAFDDIELDDLDNKSVSDVTSNRAKLYASADDKYDYALRFCFSMIDIPSPANKTEFDQKFKNITECIFESFENSYMFSEFAYPYISFTSSEITSNDKVDFFDFHYSDEETKTYGDTLYDAFVDLKGYNKLSITVRFNIDKRVLYKPNRLFLGFCDLLFRDIEPNELFEDELGVKVIFGELYDIRDDCAGYHFDFDRPKQMTHHDLNTLKEIAETVFKVEIEYPSAALGYYCGRFKHNIYDCVVDFVSSDDIKNSVEVYDWSVSRPLNRIIVKFKPADIIKLYNVANPEDKMIKVIRMDLSDVNKLIVIFNYDVQQQIYYLCEFFRKIYIGKLSETLILNLDATTKPEDTINIDLRDFPFKSVIVKYNDECRDINVETNPSTKLKFENI